METVLDRVNAEVDRIIEQRERASSEAWKKCREICSRCRGGSVPDGEGNHGATHDRSMCDAPLELVRIVWRGSADVTGSRRKHVEREVLLRMVEEMAGGFDVGLETSKQRILYAASLCSDCSFENPCRSHVETLGEDVPDPHREHSPMRVLRDWARNPDPETADEIATLLVQASDSDEPWDQWAQKFDSFVDKLRSKA